LRQPVRGRMTSFHGSEDARLWREKDCACLRREDDCARLRREDDGARLRREERLTDEAVFGLARRFPELSARRVISRGQAIGLALSATSFAAALCWWPHPTELVFVAGMSSVFLAGVSFRAFLAWFGARPRVPEIPAQGDDLPDYTILVPLYREAAVVPGLVKALWALDYPRARLQILLVVEADDGETIAAVERHALPPFEIVRVPPSFPRTKPKAANYALAFARGAFVVVYDAEDRPEPDQLRKAVAGFARHPPGTACLQARLVPYNISDGWLVAVFALDFDLWFNVYLPGLERLGVPIPLGGTSNHFRTAMLRAVGAWDPFNVTEDADLGLRLAQFGYRVAMLDSTTFEEAPAHLGAWIKQRSRWLKGYMQTWLVHGRNARSLSRHVGLFGFLAFQLFLGGAVLSALVNPLLWAIFLATSVLGGSHDLDLAAALGALGANALLTLLAIRPRDRRALAPYALTVTLYWMLISVAGYRGLWQLATKPFHWEKTTHGLSPHA
jgi:cellulose synthase/poly-beta-1,6-N-acetylglucosamine synthase-like glycosyltransferase